MEDIASYVQSGSWEQASESLRMLQEKVCGNTLLDQYFLQVRDALRSHVQETDKYRINLVCDNAGHERCALVEEYHPTQTNLFGHHTKVGIGPESGDLSFPEFKKIAEAFGYPYYSAHSNAEMKAVVDTVLKLEGPVFTEIFTDTKQVWEPKSSTKRLEDGTLVSPPLEDLAPFLPREELKKIMLIPLLDEEE